MGEKRKSYQASTKPKRRAPQKKNLPEDVEMFADEESEDEDNTWQQLQLEQEKQEEEEQLEIFQEALRKRRKPKNSLLDSDSESEAGKARPELVTRRPQVTPRVSKSGPLDSSSEDERPAKLSAKERRALRKAKEEERQKKLLASRKSNFWGAAKNKVKARKKKTKARSRTYIDPISRMLVTEEIDETDEEVMEVAA